MYPVSFFKIVTKVRKLLLLIVFLSANGAICAISNDTSLVRHPIYPPEASNIDALKRSVEPLMRMSLKEVIAEVPEQSGIFFIGCPNCHSGAEEMNVLTWKPGMGLTVRCNYCKMVFPNEKFPNNRGKVITAPGGARQVYRYYEDATGYPYYFEAHALYEKWLWIRPLAEKLAKIWYATRDNAYGDRAAAIAGRFAQVFPDYAVRYDYPNAPVRFFPANQKWPYEGLTPYRGAKWRWWGYDDIPTYLANVYDILQSGYDWNRMNTWIGADTDKRIADNLLRLGYAFTTANPEEYSNKSPGMYAEMIRVGRILGDPAMVHEAVKRFREFFSKGFFADGWWKEGTPSYHDMTIGSLKSVVDALEGYVDPASWKGEFFDHPDISKEAPLYEKALVVNGKNILPNGRKIPVNDTWGYGWEYGYGRDKGTDSTVSRLWPALGNATPGTGSGDNQVMLNVNWSGNYGHSHYDNGGIILYAAGQELLSDVGYTHSKYRGWTVHTASHNTVVIDEKRQDAGSMKKPVTGRLKFYDDGNAHVNVVDVDASPAYSMADVYRRRLVMIHSASGYDYVIDRFDVKGGRMHDWFLHGMCEQQGTLHASIALDRPLKTLVPEWGGSEVPKTQFDMDPKRFHAYSYLRDIRKGTATGPWTATWHYDSLNVGLRSHILSQPGTEVFRFHSPSIRLAKEDDNKMDEFLRNGIMQRHSGESSTFIAVHEPFRNAPWIESVKMEGEAIVVSYRLNGNEVEDHIVINEEGVSVRSSAGWKYASGTMVSGVVKALTHTGEMWRLVLDKKLPKTKYVRLDFSNGDTYYCHVAAVHNSTLELEDDPGFALDEKGKVQFYTFPHHRYDGSLRYTLFVPAYENPPRIYGGRYSEERIANLRNNSHQYEWARALLNAAVVKAKPWLAKSDEELWRMVPGQDLPRTIDVTYDGHSSGPKFLGCLVCGNKIFEYGNYPYNPDFENEPWKLTCPSCKSVFPTNDFGKYYQSAIDEHGLFNPAKGDTSLLFNTDHPDPMDPLHKFGVDDGFGYVAKNGRAYKFIGYYSWKYWEYLNNGLAALADAFLYTGDKRYAHKAAILLDRIADVYPDMDWKPYADRGWYHSDGGTGLGKIEGSIWETGVVQQFADSYDKILSGTQDDAALYAFLKSMSQKYTLPGAKGSRELFVANIDDNILKTAFDAVLSRQIRGNQGMHQLTVAACALALNTEPVTKRWLDWLFEPDGGAIPGLMLNHFDRDGTSDEGAPGYAFIWAHQVTKIAELLSNYPGYTAHNIFRDFPQFRAAFKVAYRMAALGVAIPNIGDYGATGLVSAQQADPKFMSIGYKYTRDPQIAIAAYRANGNSARGLGFDIYSRDPELLHREIQKIGERAGPRPVGGYLLSGFGLALLESAMGPSGIALASNYGRTKMHAHPDLLNFDIFAFGNWLAPDHGYPEFATKIPSNIEWTGSTISHNTVFVNQHPQRMIWGGHTRLFTQVEGFGAFELDGRPAYPETKEYTRTMLLIGGDDSTGSGNNAYIVDIFRVKGGYDHVYSFHGPPGMITNKRLQLKTQDKGTYAGANIPKGAAAKNFPDGYSFLYNVRKDEQPPANFVLDWKVQNGYRGATAKDNIHLRMHALTSCSDVALADGDPPQNKPGNPRRLGYVLMHRSGTDLNSTFVSVFEPYRNQPFITSVQRLDDGNGEQVAIKVEKADGHTDYLLYNPASQTVMRLPNGISMTGTIGYLQEKNGWAKKGVLVNGKELKHNEVKLTSTGVITGKVVKMDKELDGKGWLLVDSKLPLDKSLIGEQIIIETTRDRDATYTIHDIQQEGRLAKISCGPISFVCGFRGGSMVVRTATLPRTYSEGYLYDFEEGASFAITSHKVWNAKAP